MYFLGSIFPLLTVVRVVFFFSFLGLFVCRFIFYCYYVFMLFVRVTAFFVDTKSAGAILFSTNTLGGELAHASYICVVSVMRYRFSYDRIYVSLGQFCVCLVVCTWTYFDFFVCLVAGSVSVVVYLIVVSNWYVVVIFVSVLCFLYVRGWVVLLLLLLLLRCGYSTYCCGTPYFVVDKVRMFNIVVVYYMVSMSYSSLFLLLWI